MNFLYFERNLTNIIISLQGKKRKGWGKYIWKNTFLFLEKCRNAATPPEHSCWIFWFDQNYLWWFFGFFWVFWVFFVWLVWFFCLVWFWEESFVCLLGFCFGFGSLGFITTRASLLPHYYFLYSLPPSCGLNLPLSIQLFLRQAIYIFLSI